MPVIQAQIRNIHQKLACLFVLANIGFQERHHGRGNAMFDNSNRKKLSSGLAAVVSVLALILSSATPAIAEESVTRNVDIEVYSSFVDPCTFEPMPVIWVPLETVYYDDMDGMGRYDTEMGEQSAEASLFMGWDEGSDSCGDVVSATGTVTADLTMSADSLAAGLDDFTVLCRDFVGESAGNPVSGCAVPNVYEVTAKITIPADTAPGFYSGEMSVTWVP
jgi:hypothetical protein